MLEACASLLLKELRGPGRAASSGSAHFCLEKRRLQSAADVSACTPEVLTCALRHLLQVCLTCALLFNLQLCALAGRTAAPCLKPAPGLWHGIQACDSHGQWHHLLFEELPEPAKAVSAEEAACRCCPRARNALNLQHFWCSTSRDLQADSPKQPTLHGRPAVFSFNNNPVTPPAGCHCSLGCRTACSISVLPHLDAGKLSGLPASLGLHKAATCMLAKQSLPSSLPPYLPEER